MNKRIYFLRYSDETVNQALKAYENSDSLHTREEAIRLAKHIYKRNSEIIEVYKLTPEKVKTLKGKQ